MCIGCTETLHCLQSMSRCNHSSREVTGHSRAPTHPALFSAFDYGTSNLPRIPSTVAVVDCRPPINCSNRLRGAGVTKVITGRCGTGPTDCRSREEKGRAGQATASAAGFLIDLSSRRGFEVTDAERASVVSTRHTRLTAHCHGNRFFPFRSRDLY